MIMTGDNDSGEKELVSSRSGRHTRSTKGKPTERSCCHHPLKPKQVRTRVQTRGASTVPATGNLRQGRPKRPNWEKGLVGRLRHNQAPCARGDRPGCLFVLQSVSIWPEGKNVGREIGLTDNGLAIDIGYERSALIIGDVDHFQTPGLPCSQERRRTEPKKGTGRGFRPFTSDASR
jgi:hypothetical protein